MTSRPVTSADAFQKGLPASLEHEQGLLGTCMAGDPNDLEVAASLIDPNDFSIGKNRRIWETIKKIHEAGTPIDRVGVAKALMDSGHLEAVDGLAYLSSLDPLPRIHGIVESYCKILRECSIRRMAIFEAQKILDQAFSGLAGDDIVLSFQRAGEEISGKKHRTGGGMMRVDEVYTRDFAGNFAHFVGESEQAAACPIPWKEPLNGLRLGELTILAARPGVGKSSAAAQIAAHCGGMGIHTHWWSLEMKSGLLLRRAVASRSGVSHYQMQTGYLKPESKQLAYQALSDLCEMPLRMADDAGASVEVIRRAIRESRARFEKPSLVIVDYLQLLAGNGGSNRNEEIGRISRGLKRITLEFDVAVLALSQLSRDSEKEGNREPKLSDLRDSGSLEQDADNVVFIHRPTADETNELEVLWLVKKQRNGHTGATPLTFHRDQMRFTSRTR